MIARNRRTGSPICGTLEALSAESKTLGNKFSRNDDGSINHEHSGKTEIFWDDQRTRMRRNQTIYLDENGSELVASEIELVKDVSEPLKTVNEPSERRPRPSLMEIGRESNFTDSARLYEVVDPKTGAGHGLYTTEDEALKNALPTDLIAYATYTITDAIGYVDAD